MFWRLISLYECQQFDRLTQPSTNYKGWLSLSLSTLNIFYPIFLLFICSLSLFCIISSLSFTHHAIIERTLWQTRHILFTAVSGRAVGVIFRSVNIGLRDHKNNGISHLVKLNPLKLHISKKYWKVQTWYLMYVQVLWI